MHKIPALRMQMYTRANRFTHLDCEEEDGSAHLWEESWEDEDTMEMHEEFLKLMR